MKAETLTLILVNLAGIMERADESLLPGVYKEVGEALHTGPTGLGALTLFRSMVQSLCYPLATYLAVRHNRAHVIAYGAFLWAAATFLVAFSSTYFEVAVSRALNGIGLAIVAPAIQSLVADSTDDSHRGIPGWRISFHLVAFISVVVGLLVRLFARDPHFPDGSARAVTMWLELTGFSHAKTAFLMGLFVVANSLGGLFGGMMGDVLSRRLPNSGRIILSQTSSASAIPLAAVLLLGLPDNPSTIFLHALVLSITGFCISWNAPATNNPIFAEIVPEKSRTSIYALDRSFESILSSFAPPVVGLLAQYVYGFKPVPEGSLQIATDRENATSLAKALYTAIGIPMALCCFIYSFLYRTYPRDRERAQMQALIESEMQLMELDTSRPRGVYGQVQSSDPKEHFLDDRTIIDMDCGEEEFDFDDSDEKTAIYRPSKASSSGE
nr:uncharacterized protein LOC113714624 isoform X5 [Coffea arabica]